jgi:hypothetical protein
MSPTPKNLENFMKNLLTTQGDDWTPFLGEAFMSYNMDMRVPALVKPGELKNFKQPVFIVGADGDISFPGEKLLSRAKQVFSNLQKTNLLKDSKHSPPTTPEFREWLCGEIADFLG